MLREGLQPVSEVVDEIAGLRVLVSHVGGLCFTVLHKEPSFMDQAQPTHPG